MAHTNLWLSFFLFAFASCRDLFILYPPRHKIGRPSLSFAIGDTLNATWQNSSDDPQLVLWCTLQDGGQSRLSSIGGNGLRASDSYLIPLTYSPANTSDRCHLQLTPGENSAIFAIKAGEDGATPITWGLDQTMGQASNTSVKASSTDYPTISSAPTLTVTSAAASTASTQTSATPVADHASSSLGTGARSGIGLAIGLAILGCAAVIGFVMLRRKKASTAAESTLGPQRAYYEQPMKPELPASSIVTEQSPINGNDNTSIAELPGTAVSTGSRRPS